MKLYNTLTNKLESFEPIQTNHVRIYSCGPTVYNHIHIGNLASFIYADTLRRVLLAAGYDTTHVMNITDVDDKMIKNSTEEFPDLEPRKALKALAQKYEKVFIKDMQSIGNDISLISFIRATDSIKQMQDLIKKLHKEGFAYVAKGGVYFSIDAYKKSGKIYGQLTHIEDNQSQARIDNDEYDKASAHDFALWKTQKDNEPSWDFNLDGTDLTGRPGWHIECSAMSTSKLDQPFDIHTGGIDLIFPHHENEIAQSTAGVEDSTYAKLFFHNEHVLVEGKKMSKSLKNFYTLDDITKKGYDPLAFRLLTLQSHYRKPVNFSWKSLDNAQQLLHKLQAWSDLQHQPQILAKNTENDDIVIETGKKVATALGHDLNFSLVINFINELIDSIAQKPVSVNALKDTVVSVDNLLGLSLSERKDISNTQKDLLKQRQIARDSKNWDESDKLRDKLLNEGISINDTNTGQIWSRIAAN